MKEYKAQKILNTIIYVLYIPLSFFGFMCGMATDGLIDETNNIIIILTQGDGSSVRCLCQLS